MGMRSEAFNCPITTTATPYSAGDNVGGLLSFLPGTCDPITILQSLFVVDTANQGVELDVTFFSAKPAGTFTDNGAFSWTVAADKALICGEAVIPTTAYKTVGGVAVASVVFSQGLAFTTQLDGSPVTIYAMIVTPGTPTYAANATTLRIGGSLFVNR